MVFDQNSLCGNILRKGVQAPANTRWRFESVSTGLHAIEQRHTPSDSGAGENAESMHPVAIRLLSRLRNCPLGNWRGDSIPQMGQLVKLPEGSLVLQKAPRCQRMCVSRKPVNLILMINGS